MHADTKILRDFKDHIVAMFSHKSDLFRVREGFIEIVHCIKFQINIFIRKFVDILLDF